MTNFSLERRKFKRVSVLPHKYFVYCHETHRLTVALDISMGGFKIECYPSTGAKPDSTTVDIYALPNGRFHMNGVPCRVVYNIANLAEGSTFSGSPSRISGFKFKKLSAGQKDRLEHFLNFMNPDFYG